MKILIKFLIILITILIFGLFAMVFKYNQYKAQLISEYSDSLNVMFKLGYKHGVLESNTSLKHTKDFTPRDKRKYWRDMEERAKRRGIYLNDN